MIPIVLLAGFVAGALLHARAAAFAGLGCAVLWGVFVVSDGGSFGKFAESVGVGAVNAAIGVIVGCACRWVWNQTRGARSEA